jgi:hypothetical protein
MQRDMRILKDRAYGNGELLFAAKAIPDAFANWLFGAWLRLYGRSLVNFSAMRADRTVRPSNLFNVFPCCVFVPILWRYQSLCFHSKYSIIQFSTFVKCIIRILILDY